AVSGPDPPQAGEPGAAEPAQEHRLGLIVEVMGRRDPTGAAGPPGGFEKLVADAPCRGLPAFARAAERRHVATFDPARHAEPSGEDRGLPSALRGARVGGMVEMSGVEVAGGTGLAPGGEAGEERGRVGPAREGDEDRSGAERLAGSEETIERTRDRHGRLATCRDGWWR